MQHEFSIPLVNKNPSFSSWGKKTKVPNDRSFHATRFLPGSVPACSRIALAILGAKVIQFLGIYLARLSPGVCPLVHIEANDFAL